MCKKDKRNRDYEDKKFSDGKRHTKKNKPTDKKSRNNVKTELRKDYL